MRRIVAESADPCGSRDAVDSRTYLKIGCAARLLCRFLARPSLYVHVLSRDSLRAFAYSRCSPHFEIGSSVAHITNDNIRDGYLLEEDGEIVKDDAAESSVGH